MAVGTVEPLAEGALATHDPSRRGRERRFVWLMLVALGIAVAALAMLLADTGRLGIPRLSMEFITGLPSRFADRAGAFPAILGSLYLIAVTAVFAIPVGVGAAVYLEEYARPGRISRLIEVNISNLAGVPSIVYGLLGLAVFVRALGMGRSILAGGLTLGLLVLPVIITAAREAIRAVPGSIREGALALGATELQTTFRQVLPAAIPGVMTGIIIALSRALGETAPLVFIAATGIFFTPTGLGSEFTALPVQIFSWTIRPQEAFAETAAAGIVVLLVVLLIMNTIAVVVRNRYERKW